MPPASRVPACLRCELATVPCCVLVSLLFLFFLCFGVVSLVHDAGASRFLGGSGFDQYVHVQTLYRQELFLGQKRLPYEIVKEQDERKAIAKWMAMNDNSRREPPP